MKTKRDFCNECIRNVRFRYVRHDEYSVFCLCVDCGASFDLINDGVVLRQFKPDPTVRIAWYLRKVAQYNRSRFDILCGRPAKVPPASRPSRLLAYKLALNTRLMSAG